MPAQRYVEENGLATINRSAGVVPEVNLRECVTCMPWPSTNKVAHSGFETQKRRQQKSKHSGISGPTKSVPNSFLKMETETETRCHAFQEPRVVDRRLS